jgi:hypothetical protein
MMTSVRKIEANRHNGRKSCGPRTAAGKATASRNALQHGLAALTHRQTVPVPEVGNSPARCAATTTTRRCSPRRFKSPKTK